ncbi:sensor histidine kinase [Halobacteriales archaeon QH_2_65_14]|nr:MAG: sensor histidine kinase [Halobacteriales archaeon QH_2_65_14]
MSGDNFGLGSFPADSYPEPVCSYTVENSGPVVRATNESFDERFGSVTSGEPVAAVFERANLEPQSSTSLTELLGRTEQFVVHDSGSARVGSSQRYLVRPVHRSGDDTDYLVFTDASSLDDLDCMLGSLGVDHVASVVSHDLRNPLDVAKARLRAGRESGDDEHFDHVEQAHNRMERIIQDVLTLARGEDVVEPEEPVDLTRVASEAWESVETNSSTLAVEGTLPTTVADPDRVSRLFENLFRNAVEHGSTSPDSQARQDAVEHGSTGPNSQAHQDAVEHTGPEVTVTVGDMADGFFVADDGPGIAPEERELVFEPGYTPDEHGTGLGLAIVSRIADLHGWTVNVTTAEEGGARFEITGVDPA